MDEKITSVEITNDTNTNDILLVVRREEKRRMERIDLNNPNFAWLKNNGFVSAYYGWHGYGIAKHKDGRWFNIDVRFNKIEDESGEIGQGGLKNFIMSKIVPETEWYPEAIDTPIKGINKL